MRKRLALPLAGIAGLAVAVVPALAADQTIEARDNPNRFEPKTVTVDPGNKVTITKGATALPHNVHWDDRGGAEMGASNAGWSTERSFSAADAGKTLRFYCEPHGGPDGAGMSGSVVVTGGSGTTTQTQPTQPATTTTPPPGGGTTTGTTTATLPPPESDDDAPTLSRLRGTATRRVLTVRLGVDEAGDVIVTVTRNGRRVVRRTFERSGSGNATLRIRRRFPRGRLVVRVHAVDAAGNRSSARTLRLRVR